MIELYIYVILLLVSALVIAGAILVVWKADSGAPREADGDEAEVPVQVRGGRRPRRRINTRQDDDEDEELDLTANLEDDDPLITGRTKSGKKIGAKKLQSLQRKQERRLMNAQMEEERKQRKLREAEEEEERLRQKEEEAAEKVAEEEAEKKRLEEIAAAEAALLDEWKGQFEVLESGTDKKTSEEKEQQEQKFIEYVKEQKLVQLEELAVTFSMRTQDVVELLERLDKEKILQGVIDDRGKFIYITDNEMEAITTFIGRKGRISMKDISMECNRVIDLSSQVPESDTPTASPTDAI